MKDTHVLYKSRIIENTEIASGYFRIKIDFPNASSIRPGQFFHVRVADRLDIILRRPLSVFDFDDKSFNMLYEVLGKGTELLSKKIVGEELDILGPIGKGFSIDPSVKQVILIGGGVGIAPLYSWAKELRDNKKLNIDIYIGGRSKTDVLCEEDFEALGLVPQISTDDGSYGVKGFITDLLKQSFTAYNLKLTTCIYACGPEPMLKAVSDIIKQYNIRGELSLDKQMCCGVGACLGCVVKTNDGKYKRVCKDGPVFDSKEIVWD